MTFFESLHLSASHIVIFILAYLLIVRALRYRRLAYYKELYKKINGDWSNPLVKREHDELFKGGMYEFPFLTSKAFSIGLFKTYGIPTISKLLAKTKQFETATLKRFEDTDILMREVTENPLNSTRSHTALRRINHIHGKYKISNDDMLYTLCVFCCEPHVWISQYEWRELCEEELDATYRYWRSVGVLMGIHSIPGNFKDMLKFYYQYEEKNMVYAESNHVVGEATIKLFLSNMPPFARQFGKKVVISMLEDRVRIAMGYDDVSPLFKKCVKGLLKLRGFIICHFFLPRIFPLRRTNEESNLQGLFTLRFHEYEPLYKNGYKIEDIGTSASKKGALGELGVGRPHSVLPAQKDDSFSTKVCNQQL